MKKALLFVTLLSAFCLPSIGQIRYIYDDEKVFEGYGSGPFYGIGEIMFSYRVVYGRYPDEKRILLDYLKEVSKKQYNDYKADSTMLSLLAERDSILSMDLNDPENMLVVSGDTCTFSYAIPTREHTFYSDDDTVPVVRTLRAIQCIGGLAELQRIDYDRFQSLCRSHFYDKDGKCLWSLSSLSPLLPREVNRQFRYVVTMEPRILHEDQEFVLVNNEVECMPVLISISITRSGTLSYEIPRLEGVQLYYQELGKQCRFKNAIGKITAEEAIDPARLDAVRAYLTSYLDEHEEVESIKTWELVLFNNPPDEAPLLD